MGRLFPSLIGWVVLTTTSVGAQKPGDTVPLPFQPEIGAEYSIVVVRTKTDTRNAASTRVEAKITARLRIDEESPDGYLAEWETQAVEVGDFSITDQPDLFIGVPVQIELAMDGTPVSIPDWPRVREQILTALRHRKVTDDAGLKFMDGLMRGWSEDVAARALFADLAVVALCQGTELSPGEPISSTYELPNVMGGPPFEAQGTYSLLSVDAATGSAHIVWRQDVNEAQFTDAIRQTMNSIRRQKGLGDETAPFTVKRYDVADCKVRMSTGVVAEVRHTATVETTGHNVTHTKTDERYVTIEAALP